MQDFSGLQVVGRVQGGGGNSDEVTAGDFKQGSSSISIPSSCLLFQADSLGSLAEDNIDREELCVCADSMRDADGYNFM